MNENAASRHPEEEEVCADMCVEFGDQAEHTQWPGELPVGAIPEGTRRALLGTTGGSLAAAVRLTADRKTSQVQRHARNATVHGRLLPVSRRVSGSDAADLLEAEFERLRDDISKQDELR